MTGRGLDGGTDGQDRVGRLGDRVLGEAVVAERVRGAQLLLERLEPADRGGRAERGGDPPLGVGGGRGVEREHVGEHGGVRLGVRQVVLAPEDVADLVVQGRAGRRERGRRQVRRVQGVLAALEPARVGDHLGQPGRERPDALGREGGVDRVRVRPPHRVDAVRERVQARRDRQLDRKGRGQRGVVDDDLRQHREVGAGRLGGALGETPDRGRLGARVRGRDGDDRQPGGHRDRLGQPRGRAAADADQGVDVAPGGRRPGPLGHLDRDVHDDLVVAERDRDPGRYLVGQVHRVR